MTVEPIGPGQHQDEESRKAATAASGIWNEEQSSINFTRSLYLETALPIVSLAA